MKAVADNNQPINKISDHQQLSTLQNKRQQATKKRNNTNETIAISPNEIDESTHCFRTKLNRENKIGERSMYRNNKVAAKAKIISRRAGESEGHITEDRGPIGPNILIEIFMYFVPN